MKLTSALFFTLRSVVVLLAIASCTTTPAAPPNAGSSASSTFSSASSTTQSVAVKGTPQPYQKTVLLNNLEHPWSMAWLPDGAMLITERPGRLRLFQNGKLEPNPIVGLPANILAAGQGGLMDISVHPKFAENRFVYFTYAYGTQDANRTRLARAKFDGT
jgi:aldose sugar dehydrogenase